MKFRNSNFIFFEMICFQARENGRIIFSNNWKKREKNKRPDSSGNEEVSGRNCSCCGDAQQRLWGLLNPSADVGDSAIGKAILRRFNLKGLVGRSGADGGIAAGGPFPAK